MGISRLLHRLGNLKQEIEFLTLVFWILFFPDKNSYLYFLVFAFLIIFFSVKNLYLMKNVGISACSYCMILFNLLFIVSIFFSGYALKSVLFYADVFLVSAYYVLFYFDEGDEERYMLLLLFPVSIFSLINVLNALFLPFDKKNLLYENPILTGIISGLGVIVAVYFLLKKWKGSFLVSILINCAGVFLSGSKAAFLGMVLLTVYMVILKKKWILPLVLLFVALTFVIPNPLRDMFHFSLKKDPYAFNRIDIWNQSLIMFRDNMITGIGLDNYSELSKKYNFKQNRGQANYYKIPRIPHNDYLKIIVETGIAGLLLLSVFLFFILRRTFSAPLFNIPKILILYLLFQAFIFNILFQFFFFFVLMFLLKCLFEKNLSFLSLSLNFRLYFSTFLMIVFVFAYLSPFLSNIFMENSKKGITVSDAFSWIKKAEYLNPLDFNIYYAKSLLYYSHFQMSSDLESFENGIRQLKRVQNLNENFLPSYLLEAEFYIALLKNNLKYDSLAEEILSPLERAEHIAPYDPFVQFKKAQVFWEFNEKEKAKEAVLHALDIEPEFVSALYFLKKYFNYFQDEDSFQEKIKKIRAKAEKLKPKPGSYLFELFKLPVSM